MIGQRLGPYLVLSSLGEGGMGAVYRARDTKLERDVAIKILTADTDATGSAARHQREAQILASLNHPHIAAIYGLEESAGTHFLVLELVEGQTLERRLKSGPIPTAEAMAIAQQIADAVGAAHERGVIHRDLKPANIAFTDEGQVKVLDFGVAKVMSDAGARPLFGDDPDNPASTTVAPAARSAQDGEGSVVGTVAYMAPEQTKGRDADKRCDVWAFGCVVYEMLTGRRAFGGETVAETIAAVLTSEPDWEALPADVPPPVKALIRGCLEKDRHERVVDIAAALFVFKHWRAVAPEMPAHRDAIARSRPDRWRPLLLVAAGLAGALVAGGLVWLAPRDSPARVTRTTITPSGPTGLTVTGNSRDLAITGDGSRIVYVGNNGTQLLVRALDVLDPVALAGDAPRDVFTSPDGQWVGFFRLSVLSKVPITGGPPVTVAIADGPSRGAAWGTDGSIVFATPSAATGLYRVAANGGDPEVLTRPDRQRGEGDHLWPAMLPRGRGVIFTIVPASGDAESAEIAVLDFRTGESRILVQGGSDARYLPSGHLVYVADGTLRAVAFDLDALQIRGTSVPVVPGVVTTSTGGGAFAAADDGTLVYVSSANRTDVARTMAWVDRSGREELLGVPPRDYVHPRISPDGTLVAVSVAGMEEDIWMWDFGRATLSRITSERGTDHYPAWMPDGRRLVFSSARDGGSSTNLYWQSRDGISPVERLTTSPNVQQVTAVTPDGASVIFQEIVPATGRDIMRLRLDAGLVEPLLQTRFDERNGSISPDGRWLAYESNSSGRLEVYVRPFPRVDSNQWQVSIAGGSKPLWAPGGAELFYLGSDGALMAAPVGTNEDGWSSGAPAALFTPAWSGDDVVTGRTYDVSPDGRRFLFIRPAAPDGGSASPTVVVVQNWFTELRRLVPGN